MLPYQMLAHQIYEERLREAEPHWRRLAEQGLTASPERPRRRMTLLAAALRALARLRRPTVARPA